MPWPTTTIRFDIADSPSSDEAMRDLSNPYAMSGWRGMSQPGARPGFCAPGRCRGIDAAHQQWAAAGGVEALTTRNRTPAPKDIKEEYSICITRRGLGRSTLEEA